LCIIQNSPDDWEDQCRKMSQIYMGSMVTIAGPAAVGAESGFLHPRRLLGQTTLQMADGKASGEVTITHFGVFENPYLLHPEQASPLAQRGWVVQERLLSHRILYFGSNNMYLECFTNVRFDSCRYPICWKYQDVDIIPKSLIAELDDANMRLEYWISVVQTYGETQLTDPNDKFPALSGLAYQFNQVTGYRYLAGLWEDFLHPMLTWFIPYYHWNEMAPKPFGKEYIAPSWSWASAKHDFIFSNYSRPFHADLQIIEAEVTTSGLDPFGKLTDGYLRVRAKSRHAVIRTAENRIVPKRQHLYLHSESLSATLLGSYYPDDGRTATPSESRAMLLYLGFFRKSRAVALVVAPFGPGQNVFRRIGLANTDDETEKESLLGYFAGVEEAEFLIH
jgi:hypothetical protein